MARYHLGSRRAGEGRLTAKTSFDSSERLFRRAQTLIPGGVNSPVRAFTAVGGSPRFIQSADGPCIFDVDGRRYTDFVMSWGPLIHGHAYPPVIAALRATAARGTSFGAPNPLEVELAELITRAMPSVEMVRFVNSGTEAAMSAIRLARAYTGRDLIIKFAGNYHGHADMLLVSAGSGALTLGVPTSPGVTAATTAATLVLPYNSIPALEQAFQNEGDRIAAVIVEPIAANMGVVLPATGFLESLADLTRRHEALVVFDEVITGFRVGLQGAQGELGIAPDLTILGKIIGGGLPVGAYGGRADIMQLVAPAGPVYQAGTLSGNPIAMAAGIANLEGLHKPDFYANIARTTNRLAEGLRGLLGALDVPATVNSACGLLTLFFDPGPIKNLDDADRSDRQAFARFFHAMLDRGIYLPPSQFEAWMISSAHGDELIDRTLAAAGEAFREAPPGE